MHDEAVYSTLRWTEKNVYGDMVERRTVETPDGRYDPLAVPPEWNQWLKHTRKAAPTPEEVLGCGGTCMPWRTVYACNAGRNCPLQVQPSLALAGA
jgi:NADH:ubiquinone oxidoreductase subunit